MKLKTKNKVWMSVSILAIGLLVFFAKVDFSKAGGSDGSLKGDIVNLLNNIVALVDKMSGTEEKLGAYIASPTGFTDVNITNDLVVDGLTTLTGATTVTGALTVTANTLTVGSVPNYQKRMTMNIATTTPCAIQSPSVTSTLAFASAGFTISSTTASVVTIAKSATAFVTTTIIGSAISIAANAQATIVASSTLNKSADDTLVFAPSQWLVMGMQGGTGTFSPTGNCEAYWIKNY